MNNIQNMGTIGTKALPLMLMTFGALSSTQTSQPIHEAPKLLLHESYHAELNIPTTSGVNTVSTSVENKFETKIVEFYQNLMTSQKMLDPSIEELLNEHAWDLYETV